MVRIELGDVVRDSITGFEGVVIADTSWLHGCRRLTVQPSALHDGRPVESCSFDELQLLLVRKSGHEPQRDAGGPRPEPSRAKAPTR
jgi:hypothetical protein